MADVAHDIGRLDASLLAASTVKISPSFSLLAAPEDMAQAVEKVTAAGNERVIVTERGTTFGYHNLVVDMRSLGRLRELGFPVVFDATHSVQLPSAAGGVSGGEREFVALLARAATAAGVDGIFLETHPSPETALCDAASQWPLSDFEELMRELGELHAVRGGAAVRP